VRSADSVVIANNTLILDRAQRGIGMILGEGDPSEHVQIVNNIISGALQSYYLNPGTAATARIDYNLCFPINQTIGFRETIFMDIAQWRAAGFDVHGLQGDPAIASGSFCPGPNSPAIDKGAPLAHLFTTDINGTLRAGVWDIGACEYKARPPVIRQAR
jgi:hypothetical protein